MPFACARHAIPTLLLVASVCGGCTSLKLGLVDSSVRKPSNVAIYFTVDTSRGDPVPDLTPQDFRIYEDGAPVSTLESKQTILQPEVAAVHYTLLLVDMSGSVVESTDVPHLLAAASTFAERVGPYQKVAVYAFDGSPHLAPIAGFGADVQAGIRALGTFRPRDPSTNLNGAIVESIKVLDRQMEHASVPLRFGTLVVFTDGTDRAHRVSNDDLHKALEGTDLDVFAIAVGDEIDESEIRRVGRSGSFTSKKREDIARGFDEIAARIEGYSKRYYLLSYCSPSRAGKHDVEVEANKDGKSGRLRYQFDASGFAPNCDPNTKPAFNVHRPRVRNLPGQASRDNAPKHAHR